jgi:hypothetical protein
VSAIEAICLQQIFLILGQPGSEELADQGVIDYDPEFEPYCSMSRERIAELMDQAFRAGDVRKWFMLAEFHYDKMDEDELKLSNLTCELMTIVNKEDKDLGPKDQMALIRSSYELASLACGLAKRSGEC